jgi:molecular chaperone Hsp33
MHDFPDIDYTQRFIFDESDVRGELVALERSYAEVLAKHPYPEPVAQLLGEMLAAAALLVGTLKFDGLLVLQARSPGPVSLLMVQRARDSRHRPLRRKPYNA